MSKNANLARHRATPVRSNPFKAVSKAVSSNAGSVGRPAAAVVAASGLMLGFGAPANASTPSETNASVSTTVQSSFESIRAGETSAKTENSAADSGAAADRTTHTVESGDTLSEIAEHYGVDLDEVFSLNGLGMESIIYPGDEIKLSGEAKAPEVDASAGPYTVKSGDTLGKIAAAHGVGLDTVLALNGLGLQSVIFPGDIVKLEGTIPAAPAPAAPAPAVAPAPAAAPVAPASGVSVAASGPVQPIAPQQAAPAQSTPAPAAASNVGAALVASAYSQIGVAQDCTAMVEKALRSVGKSVGDIAPEHFYRYGSVVGTPAPGDLVISAGHVAIYVGNGKAVSGGYNGFQTVEHSLSTLSGYQFVRVA